MVLNSKCCPPPIIAGLFSHIGAVSTVRPQFNHQIGSTFLHKTFILSKCRTEELIFFFHTEHKQVKSLYPGGRQTWKKHLLSHACQFRGLGRNGRLYLFNTAPPSIPHHSALLFYGFNKAIENADDSEEEEGRAKKSRGVQGRSVHCSSILCIVVIFHSCYMSYSPQKYL